MSTAQITIEQLEALAATIETEESATRARLVRLMTAYARIIAVREPGKFTRRAVELSDEDGHYDNSYPPAIKHKDYSGPRALRLVAASYDKVATEGGFYHAWRAVTDDCGLYITPTGRLIGADYDGTGSLGQFASHPGDCDVQIEIRWDDLDPEDITTARLTEAEKTLREIAFPLIAAAQSAA